MTPRLQKLFDILGRESLLPKERLNEITVEIKGKTEISYLYTGAAAAAPAKAPSRTSYR